MTLSVGVDTLNPVKTTGTTKVSASVGTDGASIDASTSQVVGGTGQATTATNSKELGKNDFLNLLVTQLRYQDPMSPMDNSQFLTQMAQFTALETNTNIQTAIENLDKDYKSSLTAQMGSSQAMTNASSVSLIGKEVMLKESNVQWGMEVGNTIPITVHLGNNTGADVQILDSDGKVVKTLRTNGKDASTSSTVSWDGTTDSGTYAQAGTYKVNIVGQDKDSSLYAYVKDVVQGVRFADGGAYLKVGGKEISASDIVDVSLSQGSTGFEGVSSAAAVELLGKNVRARQDTVQYKGLSGESDQIKVNAAPGATVSVAITDGSGTIVTAFKETADANGVATMDWDGQAYDGSYAAKGSYNILIDGQENDPTLYSFTEGQVQGLSNLNGLVQLKINGKTVNLSDILDVSPQTEASAT